MEAGTETLAQQGTRWELRLRQACTIELRDLFGGPAGSAPQLPCTLATLQMEFGRATPTRTFSTLCTIEIRDLLRRISVILPGDQKEQEEETEEEEEEEEEEAEREIQQRMYHKTLVSLTCGTDMSHRLRLSCWRFFHDFLNAW